jgi:membrane protease YdiL (CAAX protease family)
MAPGRNATASLRVDLAYADPPSRRPRPRHHFLALASFCDLKTTVIACLGIFAGGVIWSAIYERYRSVWVPWVSHAIVGVAVFGIGWVVLFG